MQPKRSALGGECVDGKARCRHSSKHRVDAVAMAFSDPFEARKEALTRCLSTENAPVDLRSCSGGAVWLLGSR